MSVRTRFAPSPTGYLHIGGVRTALFNWLLAKRHGGQFLLRIDDTDEARNVDEAVGLIQSGFRWVGIMWDEGPVVGGPHGPYFQSQRKDKYQAAIESLIEAGHAYPCLADPARIELERKAAMAAKTPFIYRGPNREMNPSEALALFREKRPAIRFKVPAGRLTVLEDKVRGKVEWQTDLVGDFTIAREGGSPLYNLASIVDDLDMRITHIVRAEEHLANTHPQMLIARGLGAETLPTFAHIPFVAEPGTKKKLSKRNPPPGVMVALEEYERAGYLPEAILNAVVRLGWSLDDHTELMSIQTMIDHFSLERVVSAAAGLDPAKIYWMQDHYMRQLPVAERVERMLPFLQKEGLIGTPASERERTVVTHVDHLAAERLKLLSDIVRYAGFFFRPVVFEKEAAKNLLKPGVDEALAQLGAKLKEVADFTVNPIAEAVKEVGAATGQGGKINHALRAAITGQTVGPGVYECAEIMGRDETLSRLAHARAELAAGRITA